MPVQISCTAGGTLDQVSYVSKIANMPSYVIPFAEMIKSVVPNEAGVFDMEYILPDRSVELFEIWFSCEGAGPDDRIHVYIGDAPWVHDWYLSPGMNQISVGPGGFVKRIDAGTKIKIQFVNVSLVEKTVYAGFRMLAKELEA